jgi:sugar/nucleoside kinase (ribokinase family)
MWDRVLDVRTQIRHVWFGLRYRRAEGSGWGIERGHWMFTSLRDAYLDDGLIDLSFQPKKRMSGSEGINMLLTAAGFGGEVAAMQAQMNDPVGDEALRVVCRQHGLDNVMDYAGKPLTRRGAALLVWRLLAERTDSD